MIKSRSNSLGGAGNRGLLRLLDLGQETALPKRPASTTESPWN
jgi:hypothetical protein